MGWKERARKIVKRFGGGEDAEQACGPETGQDSLEHDDHGRPAGDRVELADADGEMHRSADAVVGQLKALGGGGLTIWDILDSPEAHQWNSRSEDD